jgi:uroporphyrinogen-III synthase
VILITRPRKNSLEFQKRLEKLNINSEIQELSKFKISNSQVSLLNCVILITSPRSLDYLVKTKTIESCKKNEFIVIGKKTTQRLRQLGCKKILISAKDSTDLINKSKSKLNEKSDVRFLCSNVYNKELVRSLKKMKCKITLVRVYETIKVKKLKKSVINNLKNDKFSAVIFFSKFSLMVFLELCKLEKVSRSCLKKIHYICVSQRVGEFAENLGYNVTHSSNPSEQSMLGLIKKLKLK